MKNINSASSKFLSKFNLALKFQNKGSFLEAISLYKELNSAYPNHFETQLNLATCYFAIEDYKSAIDIFHKLHLENIKEMHLLNCCAITYLKLGQNSIALEFLKRLVTYDKNNLEAWVNLTYASNLLHNFTDALYYATQAISLNPKEPKLFNNLGSALTAFHRYDDALICFQTSLDIDPNEINAHSNIATILDKKEDYEASIIQFQKCLTLVDSGSQEEIELKYRMSYPLLSSGSIKLGWEFYENGFFVQSNRGRNPSRKFLKPRWDGSPIKGKKLLVWREQGLGDEVMFFSILYEVFQFCDDVIIECTDRLQPLFERAFPNCTVRAEPSIDKTLPPVHEDFDYQIPIGSLCRFFRSDWPSFKKSTGYLNARDDLIELFKSRLSPFQNKLLIGISWRSGHLTSDRNIHYAPLSDWEHILRLPHIQFVNLQYGDCEKELQNVKDFFGVDIINFADVDLKHDLESLAAIIKNLDLVISASTFAAPFSQALGIKNKLVEHKDWSMLGCTTWPWYEAVDLYIPDNIKTPFNSVFEKLHSDLMIIKK